MTTQEAADYYGIVYDVISASNPIEGWQLQGGVSVSIDGSPPSPSRAVYAQAMYFIKV